MKVNCLNCGHEFDGSISKDELGWHSVCPECECSFDVDVPEGKIVMAFAWDETDEYFTDGWYDDNAIATYYAFDTQEEFIKAWEKMVDEPDGMWYWVLDNGRCICSGACDPMDIDIFAEHFGEECDVCGKYHFDIRVDKTLKEKFNLDVNVCLDCYAWLSDEDRYEYLYNNGIIDDDVYDTLMGVEEEE